MMEQFIKLHPNERDHKLQHDPEYKSKLTSAFDNYTKHHYDHRSGKYPDHEVTKLTNEVNDELQKHSRANSHRSVSGPFSASRQSSLEIGHASPSRQSGRGFGQINTSRQSSKGQEHMSLSRQSSKWNEKNQPSSLEEPTERKEREREARNAMKERADSIHKTELFLASHSLSDLRGETSPTEGKAGHEQASSLSMQPSLSGRLARLKWHAARR